LGAENVRAASAAVLAAAILGFATSARAGMAPDDAAALDQLRGLSIEELADVQVTSVSKQAEPVAEAPASIYVITRDEILRSGATTLPDMLRLAPNLFVAQTSASTWTITARGLSGNAGAQNFPNKLLVLIDGRSVYTPLFSGVYWDMQDVPPDDVDRIEVVSGPAGTLWGANAVEGVINIITRDSDETQGGVVVADGGNQQQGLSLRYGGTAGDSASWRIYGRAFHWNDTVTGEGADARDHWSRLQGGFRFDWSASPKDLLTVQGDAFVGHGTTFDSMGGGNLLARWTRTFSETSNLQVQAYADRQQRGHDVSGGLPLWVDTYDLDVQHSFALGARNAVVWGGGLRAARYSIEGTPTFSFSPARGTLDLANLFAQDTFSVTPDLRLVLGLKLEKDPYAGWSPLPNLRIAWTPNGSTMVWAAASEAIRSPTPFDVGIHEKTASGEPDLIVGDRAFDTEKLTSYELGVRVQPTADISLSATAYYDVYDDLRSIEITPVTLLPLTWGNGIKGHISGFEAWGAYQAAPWWRLSAGVNLLREHFDFKPGASGLLGASQVGDDPKAQATLKSSIDLGPKVTWDADLRYVGALPDPRVPAYAELNSRIAWNLNDRLQLAIAGYNLLHSRHREFPAPADEVPRSVFAELRWGF
jgi:iron complex outermembrane receptor protein